MPSKAVTPVRVPELMDYATYISLLVMSLLALRGLDTVIPQLILLALSTMVGLLYHFILRAGRYIENPVIYFGSQFIVMALLLLVGSSSVDALNFIFLIVALHAALVLTRKAAALWIIVYYVTICTAVFIRQGSNGFYAAAFYLVAYVVIGFFGNILQQAEVARDRNQKILDELKETQQKLRELAVVEERNRLARDLHDSVKQQVFAISMQLGAARTALTETDKAYIPVIEAEHLAQQAGAELTTLINALRPSVLESKAFVDAIQEYINEWSRQNNIQVEATIKSNIKANQDVEQALFRVLQEALSNAARHSNANNVMIEIRNESNMILLSIRDNGIGFDINNITKGIGLDSMQERLIAVNGQVDIISEKNIGTQVNAKVRVSE